MSFYLNFGDRTLELCVVSLGYVYNHDYEFFLEVFKSLIFVFIRVIKGNVCKVVDTNYLM